MRRFTALAGRVFYDPSSVSDFEPPTILDTTATTDSGNALFSVDVNDPTTVRVYVLFNDGSSAQWKSIDLAKSSTTPTRWTGGRPATGTNVEYIVQACDASGNCATSSNKAKYFKTTPPPAPLGGLTVTLNNSPTPPFTFTSAPVSAVASGASAGASVAYSLDGGPTTVGSSVAVTGDGLHTVRFAASDGSSATKSFVIDTTPPSVKIQSPPAPDATTYSIDAAPLASAYSCADASGIASCTAKLDGVAFGISGTVVPWTPGLHTLTVTATDLTGKPTIATRTYQVIYPFTGFFQPVDNPPTLNLINAGQAVPVKFSLGGNRGLNILAANSPIVASLLCSPTATVDAIPDTVAATTSGLQYDATSNQYTYVWKTAKGSTGCRTLNVTFIDGTSHTALFKFN